MGRGIREGAEFSKAQNGRRQAARSSDSGSWYEWTKEQIPVER